MVVNEVSQLGTKAHAVMVIVENSKSLGKELRECARVDFQGSSCGVLGLGVGCINHSINGERKEMLPSMVVPSVLIEQIEGAGLEMLGCEFSLMILAVAKAHNEKNGQVGPLGSPRSPRVEPIEGVGPELLGHEFSLLIYMPQPNKAHDQKEFNEQDNFLELSKTSIAVRDMT
ncbi:hypothetical protein Ancab_028044 [Ancistrocladus abbreviatus]